MHVFWHNKFSVVKRHTLGKAGSVRGRSATFARLSAWTQSNPWTCTQGALSWSPPGQLERHTLGKAGSERAVDLLLSPGFLPGPIHGHAPR